MLLLSSLMTILVATQKLSVAKSDFKCKSLDDDGEALRQQVFKHWNQFRAIHGFPEVALVENTKKLLAKTHKLQSAANELAQKACEQKEPKLKGSELLFTRDHSKQNDNDLAVEIYCGFDMLFQKQPAATDKDPKIRSDSWLQLLFFGAPGEVAVAASWQKRDDGKDVDFVAVVWTPDAKSMNDADKTNQVEVQRRVALQCGLPPSMKYQLDKELSAKSLCHEAPVAEEEKLQDEFEQRWNAYRKLHGQSQITVAREKSSTEADRLAAQLSANLAHMACYEFMPHWKDGLDTSIPAWKLLKDTLASHKQYLLSKEELEPKLTGKELADTIYCTKKPMVLKENEYNQFWQMLLAPSKDAKANAFGLRHSWRQTKQSSAMKDNYAFARPIPVQLSDSELAKLSELRNRLLPYCDEPARLDVILKQTPQEALSLPLPLPKPEFAKGSKCQLLPSWGEWFRRKVRTRWNAFRKVHGLEPIAVVGIDEADSFRSEATQAAWEMVKNACEQKEDRQRDASHYLLKMEEQLCLPTNTYISDNGEALVNALYCGTPEYKVRKGKKEEKVGKDEWLKVLLSAGMNTVAVDVVQQPHNSGPKQCLDFVSIVLPKDFKPASKADLLKFEEMHKRLSMQCAHPSAMAAQLDGLSSDKNAYCQDNSEKEETEFQEQFEKRLNQYRKFHNLPEVKLAKSSKDDKSAADVIQLASNLAHMACYDYVIDPDGKDNAKKGDAFKLVDRTKSSLKQLLYTRKYREPRLTGTQLADAIYCINKDFYIRRKNRAEKLYNSATTWHELLLPSASGSNNANVFGVRRTWRKWREDPKDNDAPTFRENFALIRPTSAPFSPAAAKLHNAIHMQIQLICSRTDAIDAMLANPEEFSLSFKEDSKKCKALSNFGKDLRDQVGRRWNHFREIHGLKPIKVVGMDDSVRSVTSEASKTAWKLVKSSCEETETVKQEANQFLYVSQEQIKDENGDLKPVSGEYLVDGMYCGTEEIVKLRLDKKDERIKEDDWHKLLSPTLETVAVDSVRQVKTPEGTVTDIFSVIFPKDWKQPSAAEIAEFTKLRKHIAMQCVNPAAMTEQLLWLLQNDKTGYCRQDSDSEEAKFQEEFEKRWNQYRTLHGQSSIKVSRKSTSGSKNSDAVQLASNLASMACFNRMITPKYKRPIMKVEALKLVERTKSTHEQVLFERDNVKIMFTGTQLADAVYCSRKDFWTALKEGETSLYDRFGHAEYYKTLLAPSADSENDLFGLWRTWREIPGKDSVGAKTSEYFAFSRPTARPFTESAKPQHDRIREQLKAACAHSDATKLDEILAHPEQYTAVIKDTEGACRPPLDWGVRAREQAEQRWNELRALHGLKPIQVFGVAERERDTVRNEATKVAWELVRDSCELRQPKKQDPNNIVFVDVQKSIGLDYQSWYPRGVIETDNARRGEFLVNTLYCGNNARFVLPGAKDSQLETDSWTKLLSPNLQSVAVDAVLQKFGNYRYRYILSLVLPKDLKTPDQSKIAEYAILRKQITVQCLLPVTLNLQLAQMKKGRAESCNDYSDKDEAKFQTEFEQRLNQYRRAHGQTPVNFIKQGASGPDGKLEDSVQLSHNLAHMACVGYMIDPAWNREDTVGFDAYILADRYRGDRIEYLFNWEASNEANLSGKEFADALYCGGKPLEFRKTHDKESRPFKEADWQELVLNSEKTDANVFAVRRSWTGSQEKGAKRRENIAINRPARVKAEDAAKQHEEIRAIIKPHCGTAKLDDILEHPGKHGLVTKENSEKCKLRADLGADFRADAEATWNSFRSLHGLKPIKVLGIDGGTRGVRNKHTKAAWDIVKNACEQKDGSSTLEANQFLYVAQQRKTKKKYWTDEIIPVTGEEFVNSLYCSNEWDLITHPAPIKEEKLKQDEWQKLLFSSDLDTVSIDTIQQKRDNGVVFDFHSVVLPKDWKPPAKDAVAAITKLHDGIAKLCFLPLTLARVVSYVRIDNNATCHLYPDKEEVEFQEQFEKRWNQYRKIHGQKEIQIARRAKDAKGDLADVLQLTDIMAYLACYGYQIRAEDNEYDVKLTEVGQLMERTKTKHRQMIYERRFTDPKLTGKQVADAIYCNNKAFAKRRGEQTWTFREDDWMLLLLPAEDANAQLYSLRRSWLLARKTDNSALVRRESYAFTKPPTVPFGAAAAKQHRTIHEKIKPFCSRTGTKEHDDLLANPAKLPPPPGSSADDKESKKNRMAKEQEEEQEGGDAPVEAQSAKGATLIALKLKLTACGEDMILQKYEGVAPAAARRAVAEGMNTKFSCNAATRNWHRFLGSVQDAFSDEEKTSSYDAIPNGVPTLKTKWIVDCMLRRIPQIPSVNLESFNSFFGEKDKTAQREMSALVVGIRCASEDIAMNGKDAYAELRKLGKSWSNTLIEMYDGYKAYMTCFGRELKAGRVTMSKLLGCSKHNDEYAASITACKDAVDPNSRFYVKFAQTAEEMEKETQKSAVKLRLHKLVCGTFRAGQMAAKIAANSAMVLFVCILYLVQQATIPVLIGGFWGSMAGPAGVAAGALIGLIVAFGKILLFDTGLWTAWFGT